ncbi:hypothetical protein [uncultured Aquimonas sp.]|uniref:hypothetical protein n=1 Tax=uncultured Aquimonas sp. TaxID=385483 RepID=UPI00086CA606|nr:hypothetical protein [uncultured Aquimonas sp.]ODU41524.1 MAG: hypothetical protein ABS96_31405 [Xanthomonadaceae bacterium SCN 69-123]
MAPQLFQLGEETPARQARLAQHYGEQLLGEFRLHLDTNALIGTARSAAIRQGEPLRRPISGLRFQVDLPFSKPGRGLSLDTVRESDDGVITWSGTLDGDASSLVTLSLQGEALLGRILTEGVTHILQGEEGSDYRLSVVDSARLPQLPEEGPTMTRKFGPTPAGLRDFAPRPPKRATTAAPSAKSSGSGNVRMLVLYTQAVAARNNASLLANDIVAQFNQSMASSGVGSTRYLSLAGLELLASAQTSNHNLSELGNRCRGRITDLIEENASPLNELQVRRAAYAADLVLILVSTEPSYIDCHPMVGRVGGVATDQGDGAPSIAISTDTYALGDLTALHEIGHVLGGHHEDISGYPNPGDARGFYEHQGALKLCGWQTMMGGYVECTFNTSQPNPALQTTVRLPRWSNPNQSYLGRPLGDGGHNMSRALDDDLMPAASAWVNDPPPPSPPGQLTANPAACNGQTLVGWPAVSGSTYYQLSRSTSSNFSNPTVAYSGPSTATLINLGTSGISYLRAQACNAGGCSGYSPQAVGAGYSGCP